MKLLQTFKTNVRGAKARATLGVTDPLRSVKLLQIFKTNVRGAKARATFGVTYALDP